MVSVTTPSPAGVKRKLDDSLIAVDHPEDRNDGIRAIKRARQGRAPSLLDEPVRALTHMVGGLFGLLSRGKSDERNGHVGYSAAPGRMALTNGDAHEGYDFQATPYDSTDEQHRSTSIYPPMPSPPVPLPALPAHIAHAGTEDQPIELEGDVPQQIRALGFVERLKEIEREHQARAALLPMIVPAQRVAVHSAYRRPSNASTTNTGMTPSAMLKSRTLRAASASASAQMPYTSGSEHYRPVTSALYGDPSTRRDRQRTPSASAIGGGGSTSQRAREPHELFPGIGETRSQGAGTAQRYRQGPVQDLGRMVYNGHGFQTTPWRDGKQQQQQQQQGKEDKFAKNLNDAKGVMQKWSKKKQYIGVRLDVPSIDDLRLEDLRVDDQIAKAKVKAKRIIPDRLPADKLAEVRAAMRDPAFKSALARDEVGPDDIRRLAPDTWLNDGIVNFYGLLIQQRADADPSRKVLFLSSFFWEKLVKQGYEKGRIARWTKKINIFEKDIVVFPINQDNVHWVSAAINFKDKRFEYYDSMCKSRPVDTPRKKAPWPIMRDYVQQESKTKLGKDFDFTGWEDYWDPAYPQQVGTSDCGIFTCQTLEHRARGLGDKGGSVVEDGPFEFEARHMSYMRQLMVWEIKHKKLDDRSHSG